MKLIENRKFKGVWIPKEIWFDKSLPLLSKIFMVEIDYLETTEERGCYASNKYFSEFFGLSTGRCSNIINDLKRKEFIEIKYKYEGKEIKERNIFLTEQGTKYMGGISKTKGGISKTLKRDNNTNKVSKDTYTVFEKKLAKYSKYIEAWNKHPNTTTHKITNSKTIQKLIKYFTLLESGLFYKTISINPDFIKRNNIIKIPKKITEQEIFTAIENVSRLFLEGYSPQSKSKLPKDLPSLIFNPRTGSSLFLAALFSPPKLIRKKEVQNKYPETVKKYIGCFPKDDGFITGEKFNKIIWNVNKIMDWHSKKCKRLGKYLGHTNFSDYVDGENFVQTHINWIRKEIQDVNVHVLDMDTQYWRSFIRWINDFHSINMEPTREEFKTMKLSYENAKRLHKQTMAPKQITEDMI